MRVAWITISAALLVTSLVVAQPTTTTDEGSAALVWTQGPDGPWTYAIRSTDGAVRVERRYRGVRLWVDGVQVKLRTVPVVAGAWRCDFRGESPTERRAPGRRVRTYRLEMVKGREVRELLGVALESTPEQPDTMQNLDDQIRIVSSVGPYLFVERSLWHMMACDPHGYAAVTRHAFDLRDGTRISVQDDAPPAPEEIETVCRRLRDRLREGYRGDDSMTETEVERLLAIETCDRKAGFPRFSGAAFRMVHFVSAGAPYSIGGPTYQLEEPLEIDRLGVRLEAHAEVPPLVRSFIAELPGAALGGFSLPSR